MATNENCTSNPPSSDETPNETPNVFTPEFLQKLFDREDAPLAALEAEMRGPWKVVDLPVEGKVPYSFDTERWGVLRAWEDPEVDRPAGTFHPHTRELSRFQIPLFRKSPPSSPL